VALGADGPGRGPLRLRRQPTVHPGFPLGGSVPGEHPNFCVVGTARVLWLYHRSGEAETPSASAFSSVAEILRGIAASLRSISRRSPGLFLGGKPRLMTDPRRRSTTIRRRSAQNFSAPVAPE
jgi:hypothetical protein